MQTSASTPSEEKRQYKFSSMFNSLGLAVMIHKAIKYKFIFICPLLQNSMLWITRRFIADADVTKNKLTILKLLIATANSYS